MYSFEYEYSVKVFFGEGSVAEKLTSQLDVLGGRILLTYGGSSAKKNGTLDEVLSLIRAAGKSVVEFSGIMPNPTWKKVQVDLSLFRPVVYDTLKLGYYSLGERESQRHSLQGRLSNERIPGRVLRLCPDFQ